MRAVGIMRLPVPDLERSLALIRLRDAQDFFVYGDRASEIAILARDDCKRIEYGDKSLSKPGAFFVNCGASNIFFSEKDPPRAEEPSSGAR